MVNSCFDILRSSYVEFLRRAAAQGNHLVVALGADQSVFDLKGRLPVCSEEERRFLVQNLACVHRALIGKCMEASTRGDDQIIASGNGSQAREFLYVEHTAAGISLTP